ncbi:MAG: hypothetical protein LGR52_02765 [Candidatus Thiosymbion ectosymbiont of Robbea hypermnestra]|nr:hypothetical protein [Candidatus Thiosymbion ectosymbiont of Robbea hypermnestra]
MGFDEIDLTGDTESRIAHFRTLWRLNYPQAKIMVTGRPNFFLDNRELERALGDAEQTHTLHLAPFDLDQINHSLREADPSTRKEILELARQDGKFREVVARPSLLYVVSVLWRREKLSERRRINSALVIDLFIRQTLKRQQEKQDERSFMVLNSAERHYFMTGIAAYMAAKQLPNQIDGRRLEEAVGRLVDAIPDAVSQSVGAREQNEDPRPLRSQARLNWQTGRTDIMHRINTDVRANTLLVTDPSEDGHFKFAHKSYLELLQAQTISRLFATDPVEQRTGHSIANTWKLGIDDLQNSDEAMGFLAKLLQETLHERGISEDPAVAKGLWDVLVSGKLPSRWTIAGLFKARWIAAASRLAGRLVSWFGVERKENSAVGVSTGLTAFAFAIAGAIAFASTGVIASAGTFASAGTVLGIVAGAIAVGTAAVMGTQLLVEGSGWLWQEALLLTLPSTATGLLLFLVVGLAIDFLKDRRTRLFKRLRLWYRACRDLSLPSGTIRKTAGKGMAKLLEDAEARRAEEERR